MTNTARNPFNPAPKRVKIRDLTGIALTVVGMTLMTEQWRTYWRRELIVAEVNKVRAQFQEHLSQPDMQAALATARRYGAMSSARTTHQEPSDGQQG